MTYRKSSADEMLRAWDPLVHALTLIDEEHRMVHDGAGFQGDVIQSGLADSGTGNVLIVTGSKSVHLRALDVAAGNTPVQTDFYEGATTSADGTALPSLINVNRVSLKTPLTAMYYGATVTDNGTKIATTLVPVTAKDAGAVQSSFGEELILKANTKYLITLTNNSGGPISWGFKCFFYEIPTGYAD